MTEQTNNVEADSTNVGFGGEGFAGRGAVVTGAASGIGRALVAEAAARGMRVVAADIDLEGAEETIASLAGVAGADQHLAVAVDVGDAASVASMADRSFGHLGSVDLLINNAGVFQGGVMWQRSIDDWRWTFDVNVFGIVHAVKEFVPRMIAQGTRAHIVNTASVAAFVSAPFSSPYVVSKCAAFSLTECLAHDLRSEGADIGVSVLCPSATDTGIARTDRVRPAERGVTEGDDASFVADSLAAMLTDSLDPAETARITLDSIVAGDFLIATKPSYENQLDIRHDALVQRQLPSTAPVD